MKKFKDKLQELLHESNNISPEKLEKKLEQKNLFVSANAIRGYLKGKLPQNIEYYINLAKFFNVSPMYLIDDDITNKSCNNIEIGKDLKLSDKSIDSIRSIKQKDFFNFFLQKFDFHKFIEYLNLYYKIEKIITYDLQVLLYICDIWEYILDRNINNKQEDLIEYFDKCDNAVYNIVNFTEDTPFFDASDSKYDLFNQEYKSLKNVIFNDKIESGREDSKGQNELGELLDLHDEISEKYKMYSKLIKVSITDIINDFLYIGEKKYDIILGSNDYTKMLGKYVKHINSYIKDDYKYFSKKLK